MFIPEWLKPLLGEREKVILSDTKAYATNQAEPIKQKMLDSGKRTNSKTAACEIVWQGNPLGEYLPTNQQHIVASNGDYFTIDSKRRMIIS